MVLLAPHQHHLLKVGSVVARWLGSNQRKLGCKVLGSQLTAPCTYAAAFEKVARQEFHVRADARGRDFLKFGPKDGGCRSQQERHSVHSYNVNIGGKRGCPRSA